ncbi:hypothetical protein [Thermococcus sp.]
MAVRGRLILKKTTIPFEITKDGERISLRIELSEKPLEYSVDCPCLEPLELLGLFLPVLEEELGEIEGVFVEEVREKRGEKGELTPP